MSLHVKKISQNVNLQLLASLERRVHSLELQVQDLKNNKIKEKQKNHNSNDKHVYTKDELVALRPRSKDLLKKKVDTTKSSSFEEKSVVEEKKEDEYYQQEQHEQNNNNVEEQPVTLQVHGGLRLKLLRQSK